MHSDWLIIVKCLGTSNQRALFQQSITMPCSNLFTTQLYSKSKVLDAKKYTVILPSMGLELQKDWVHNRQEKNCLCYWLQIVIFIIKEMSIMYLHPNLCNSSSTHSDYIYVHFDKPIMLQARYNDLYTQVGRHSYWA